jgi:hypothetical protein
MASSIVTAAATAPKRVALIIETSMAFGRGVLRGISRWQREHEPWRIFADERRFTEPAWRRKSGRQRVATATAPHHTPATEGDCQQGQG